VAYDAPEAWVRGVALRLLSNRLRRLRNGRVALSRHGAAAAVAGPSGDAVDITRALSALPLPHRQVVVLHYLIGLDVRAVAAELRIPEGTVKSRLSKARFLLQPLLTEETHA
jgi:RNA polymerase sigma-70 factor (ECF subfamily)